MADRDHPSGAGTSSESTPLLASDPETRGSSRNEEPITPARDYDVVIGSWVSLIVSVVVLGLWLVVSFLRQRMPRLYSIDWDARQALNPLAALVGRHCHGG